MDFDDVMDALTDVAAHLIEGQSGFLPFGAVKTEDGGVARVGAHSGPETPAPVELLQFLERPSASARLATYELSERA
jgi:hypothetical protein